MTLICRFAFCDVVTLEVRLFHKKGFSLEKVDMHGHTPLIMTAIFGKFRSMRLLIESGVDLLYGARSATRRVVFEEMLLNPLHAGVCVRGNVVESLACWHVCSRTGC